MGDPEARLSFRERHWAAARRPAEGTPEWAAEVVLAKPGKHNTDPVCGSELYPLVVEREAGLAPLYRGVASDPTHGAGDTGRWLLQIVLAPRATHRSVGVQTNPSVPLFCAQCSWDRR